MLELRFLSPEFVQEICQVAVAIFHRRQISISKRIIKPNPSWKGFGSAPNPALFGSEDLSAINKSD